MDIMHQLPCERVETARWRDRDWDKDRDADCPCHPPAPPNATPYAIEEIVEMIRHSLFNRLVHHGPGAILREMKEEAVVPLPSERTISRILKRRGLTDPTYYAPRCNECPEPEASRSGDVHEMGFVGPVHLADQDEISSVYCLNSVDVATGRCAVEPVVTRGGQAMIDGIWAIWDRMGIPKHLKLANEPAFYGTSQHPRSMGKLIRLCLLNEVRPHFIPLGEAMQSPLVEDLHLACLRWLARASEISSMKDLRRETRRLESLHLATYPPDLSDDWPQPIPPPGANTSPSTRAAFRFPSSPRAPRLPLPKPEDGRYHIVRYVARDRRFDLFGETFILCDEAIFSYIEATVDRNHQKVFFSLDATVIGEHDYTAP